jgi:hypothetical protein
MWGINLNFSPFSFFISPSGKVRYVSLSTSCNGYNNNFDKLTLEIFYQENIVT